MENLHTPKLKRLSGYKVKAGALQLSIYVAVIIALILLGLMLYAGTFLFLKEQSRAAIENIITADYGMSVVLNDSNERQQNDTISWPAFNHESQSIRTNVSQWGIFQKACVITEHRKKRFTKMAIIGSEVRSDTAPTLYLQDNYSPLSVVGNTSLTGNLYIPSAGIKTGYINGEGYNGTALFQGSERQSETVLPEISSTILSGIQFYLSNKDNPDYSYRNGKDFSGKFSNSFHVPTRKFRSENPIVLENATIIGNVIIKSDTLIRVKKTTLIKDAVLIAPVIEIEDGVTGSFQAIASDKITVGKDCDLLYPTVLAVSKSSPVVGNSNVNRIFIDKGSEISGVVFFIQDAVAAIDYNTDVLISEGVKIKGQVYCQGNLNLSGIVSGSVFAKQFIVNRFGTKFVNHLFNVVIENKNVAAVYGGLIFKNHKKEVMKWLY